ncbi:hypothetical protein AKO1_015581 [Acrasis kona]|uniref:SET domain-containing protein n=1 Tax=Acrasis kona TaxID=1008807 RepID=A0AAW2ZGY2_9EUKA
MLGTIPYPIPTSPIPCPNPDLEIRYAPQKGRSVHAKTNIAKGSLVDVSPILLFTNEQISGNPLSCYTYTMTIQGQRLQGLALGMGSMFNHHDTPNVGYFIEKKEGYIRYIAGRDIEQGEELCISYGKVDWMSGYVQDDTTVKCDITEESNEDAFFKLSGIELS